MKNAILCSLFGLFAAIASCSAIRMSGKNIKVQSEDTSKINPNFLKPSVMPAFIIVGNKPSDHQPRPNIRPFKDSVINGLMSIKKAVDENGKKLDTGLKNQGILIQGQTNLIRYFMQLQEEIKTLKLDTARLYKNSVIAKDVKNDAVFGSTLKSFAVYVMVFLVTGIIVIFITILIVHGSLSRKIKNAA